MRTRKRMEHRGENLLAGLRYDILASWRFPPPPKKCRKCGAEEGQRLSIHCNKKSCVVACGVLRARKRLGKVCYGCGSGEEMKPLLYERPELPGIPFCHPCAEHGAAFWEWHFRVWELHDQLNEYPFDPKQQMKGRHKAWPHLRLEQPNASPQPLLHHAAGHSSPAVGVPGLRSDDPLLEARPTASQVARAPTPWRYAQEPCPKVLAITLHLPWSWAFFYGGPGRWKDVENRKKAFPALPPGTILVLHNGMSYRPAAEAFVKGQLPECSSLTRQDCPQGALIGAVVVQETTKGNLFLPRPASPWYLDWGTGIWLEEKRWLFPEPIPCRSGWFGAWKLSAELEEKVLGIIKHAEASWGASTMRNPYNRACSIRTCPNEGDRSTYPLLCLECFATWLLSPEYAAQQAYREGFYYPLASWHFINRVENEDRARSWCNPVPAWRAEWSPLVLYPATRCCSVRTCPWDALPDCPRGFCLTHRSRWRHSFERGHLHYPEPFRPESKDHQEALRLFLWRMEQEDIRRSWLKPIPQE